jgi:hypothetical protein
MRGKETQLRMRTFRTLAAATVFALAAGVLSAQTIPTATISGKVVDQQGLAVPGATVTAQSPVLQGARTAITSANGDYILPFLPAGQYAVTFELPGFATVKRTQRVTPDQTVTLNPTMGVSAMTETVTVVGEGGVVGQSSEVTTSIKQDLVDKLPMGRTFVAAAMMVPGVQDSGPNGGLSINGAMSFESLFLVNGVVVNENIRGQPLGLFIEDALQETSVTTASISAEFGRFQGGVLQAITKSGGNDFSGSYRATFDNNDWVSLTPFTNDRRTDKLFLTHEGTLGGPILKDKVWFFGAGRMTTPKATTTNTMTATNINWDNVRDQKRYEGKLTWALNAKHSFKGAYTKIQDKEEGNAFTPIMDRASLVNRETPQDLLSANYTGIITPKFFVEGQYSRRRFTFVGSGSQFTDLIKGTLLLDQSRANARFNSPTFCGVCTNEGRDNQNVVLKATYYASTGSWGSHNIVGGLDMFDDKRLANNHQSGSDYRVFVTSTIIRGEDIFPVLDSRTFIRWTPIFTESEGNRFRTLSGFVNDQWNFNTKWTFNLGLRFDKNDGKNSQGEVVVKDSAISPRLSATFDPKGDGTWAVNASYGQYVAAIANGVGDASSAGGVPATIDFDYLGPAINVGSPSNPVTSAQALETMFAWFNANGGTNRPTRGAPSLPGLNTRIADGTKSPNSREFTLGVIRKLGNRGSVRVDGIYRNFHDFYVTKLDLSTGTVTNSVGRRFDLGIVQNENDLLERKFRGVNVQGSYQPHTRLTLGATYGIGKQEGNIEGETGAGGPTTSGIRSRPEYFDAEWNAPIGLLLGDVRHKARLWATYDVPFPQVLGRMSLGLVQQYRSGTPYGASGTISTSPFVTNPGYQSVPASVTYWFSARDAFKTEALARTDLSLNWGRRIGVSDTEIFFRGTVFNVTDRNKLTNFFDPGCGTGGCITTTIQTNLQVTTLARFNPFTETPVEGTHWRKAPTFGQPLSRFAYQTPRTYGFSVGIRF